MIGTCSTLSALSVYKDSHEFALSGIQVWKQMSCNYILTTSLPSLLLGGHPLAVVQCLLLDQFPPSQLSFWSSLFPQQSANPLAAGELSELLCASGYREVGNTKLQQCHYSPFICQKRSSCALNYQCAQERFPLKSILWLEDLKL